MFLKKISNIITENEGQLFDYGQDGILILDKSGKKIYHLPSIENECVLSESLEKLRVFFENAKSFNPETNNIPSKKLVCIDIDITAVDDIRQRKMFFEALNKIFIQYNILLRIHFEIAPQNLIDLLTILCNELKIYVDEHRINFQLHGYLPDFQENEQEFLFDNNFGLFHVQDSFTLSKEFQNNVIKLTEFGFRILFVLYVSEQNIHQIFDAIEKSMEYNAFSGFLLPLESERFFRKSISDPHSSDYLQLLLSVYQKYPFYDDIIYPLCITREASLASPAIPMLNFQWDPAISELQIKEENANKLHIHALLFKLFLWQRWVVFQSYLKR
jgi:hypothetical protein